MIDWQELNIDKSREQIFHFLYRNFSIVDVANRNVPQSVKVVNLKIVGEIYSRCAKL